MLISCVICFVESHPNNPNNESGVIAQCIAHLRTSSPWYPLACNSFCHSKAQVQCCKRIWDNVSGSFGPKRWLGLASLWIVGMTSFKKDRVYLNLPSQKICVYHIKRTEWAKRWQYMLTIRKGQVFLLVKTWSFWPNPATHVSHLFDKTAGFWFHLTEMVTLPETNIAPEKSKIMVGLFSFWDGLF